MHKFAIPGVVALAALLGGAVVIPTVALAQPASGVRPAAATAVRAAETARIAAAVREVERAWPAGLPRPAGLARVTGLTPAAASTQSLPGAPMISCVLATDCLGVQGSAVITVASASGGVGRSARAGAASAAAPPLVRAVRWNGLAWKGVGVSLPRGAKSVDVGGVSCKGAKSCLVVGDYFTSTSDTAVPRALTLIYNGTSLKPTPVLPLPKGATDVTLNGVSCVTTRFCVAIGQGTGAVSPLGYSPRLTLIETWNGATWTLRKTFADASKSSDRVLDLVSCATTAFCVLAGDTLTVSGNPSSPTITFKQYLGWWNGSRLTTMRSAAVGSPGDLVAPNAVSCATPASCAMTGVALDTSSSNGPTSIASYTELWNGKAWQLVKTPWPAGDTISVLDGLSCYAARSCEGVGVVSTDPLTAANYSIDAAAVSYHGGAGTLQAIPGPSKGDSDTLEAVSCLPWGTCVAVGETGKTTAQSFATMTGIWNGKSWRLAPGF